MTERAEDRNHDAIELLLALKQNRLEPILPITAFFKPRYEERRSYSIASYN